MKSDFLHIKHYISKQFIICLHAQSFFFSFPLSRFYKKVLSKKKKKESNSILDDRLQSNLLEGALEYINFV